MNTDQSPPSDEIDAAVYHAVHRGHRMALGSAWVGVVACLVASGAVLVGSLLARAAISDQRPEARTSTAVEAAGPAERSTSTSADPSSSTILDAISPTATAMPRAPLAPVLVIDVDDPASPSYVELSWTIPEESGPIDGFVVFRDEIVVHSGTERRYRATFDGKTHQYMVRAIGPAARADSNVATIHSQPFETVPTQLLTQSNATDPASPGTKEEIPGNETDKEQPDSATQQTSPPVTVSEEPTAPSVPG